jgi:hypothetical protein
MITGRTSSMFKKIITIAVLLLFAFQGVAFAQSGEIILEDTIYGVVIGAILGGAIYLLDQENIGEKVGTGAAVGAIVGFAIGITDAKSFVEIENKEIKIATPSVKIEKRAEDVRYSANLLSIKF